jgi:peptidyl-prolyl cis-trans isomerase C
MKHNYIISAACFVMLFGCGKPEQPVEPADKKPDVPVVLRSTEDDSGQEPVKKETPAQPEKAEEPEQVVPEKKITISEPERQAELTTNDLALVHGIPVKADEFYRVFGGETLDKLPNYLRREYNKNRRIFIDRLISNKIFEYAAGKEDFSNDPEYRKAIDDALRKVNMQFFYDRYITANVKIDEKELKEYYNKNIDDYVTPERIRARHILVEVKPEAFRAEAIHAREKIERLKQRVREGESFEEIAGVASDCPSKVRGGDLGFFQRGQMEEKFEKVAFSLEKDEISDVVETTFGYHIIKLIDRIPRRQQSFDEVKTDIQVKVNEQREQELYLDILKTLTNKYEVIRNEELIRKLVQPF